MTRTRPADGLSLRARGRAQLLVGTVGLSVASVAGVGVVTALAAEQPNHLDQPQPTPVEENQPPTGGGADNGTDGFDGRFDRNRGSFQGGQGFVGPSDRQPVAGSHGS